MKKISRIFGGIGVAIVFLILGGAIIANMVKPSISEMVWDKNMTTGNLEAKNYFIIYSDIMCPYCVAFENAIFKNEEEFEEYIKENDILVEVRLSDYLYQYGRSHPINSRYSALATYCAKNEGKFWDYYKLAITTVWDDYYNVFGSSAFTKLESKDKDFWISLGKRIGLGEEFETCVKDEATLDEIVKNAEKTIEQAAGMPYFKFNDLVFDGFSPSGTWKDVLRLFEAGLNS